MDKAKLRKAALRLCQLRGVDPDARVSNTIRMPHVDHAAKEILRHWQVLQAIDFAVNLDTL